MKLSKKDMEKYRFADPVANNSYLWLFEIMHDIDDYVIVGNYSSCIWRRSTRTKHS